LICLEKRTVLSPVQIWANTDCGLKTRRWEAVQPALITMAEAARVVRADLALFLRGDELEAPFKLRTVDRSQVISCALVPSRIDVLLGQF
jgi:hypothetical protein